LAQHVHSLVWAGLRIGRPWCDCDKVVFLTVASSGASANTVSGMSISSYTTYISGWTRTTAVVFSSDEIL